MYAHRVTARYVAIYASIDNLPVANIKSLYLAKEPNVGISTRARVLSVSPTRSPYDTSNHNVANTAA